MHRENKIEQSTSIEAEYIEFFQSKSLEILKEFHQLCLEHDLKYVLDSGTLLGAVRHKGFIPWDDDIDVAMPRSDFEKFIRIAPKFLPDHLFVQVNQYDRFYYQHFAKIRDTRTSLTEEYLDHFSIQRGIWMDIFPYDYSLASEIEENKRVKKINRWYKIWALITPVIYEQESKSLKNLIKKKVIRMLKKSQIKNGLLMRWIQKKHELCREEILKTNCENYSRVCRDPNQLRSYNMIFNELRLKDSLVLTEKDFKDRILMEFEGNHFFVPRRYHEILSSKYGDYQKLPPKEARKSHHRIVGF